MGYRLEISEVNYKVCGGKLFGYFGNMKDELIELKSYKWLLDNNFIEGDEYWNYGCNPQIILSAEEFKKFIELYNQDWNNCYKGKETKNIIIDDEDMKELINNDNYKLLEWF